MPEVNINSTDKRVSEAVSVTEADPGPSSRSRSTWRAARLTWQLMTPRERKTGTLVAFGLLATSMVDTIALVGVMPLVSLIIEPEVMRTNAAISRIHMLAGEPAFRHFILMVAAGAIGLIATSVAMNLMMQVIIKRYRISCQNRLARELITMCVRAPYAWLLRQNSTTLAHYVFNDVLSWSSGGIHGIMAIISHGTLLLLVVAVVLSTAALPGLVGLFVIGAIAVGIMLLIRPTIRRLSAYRRTAAAQSYSFASEFLGGIKDVKLSGRDEVFVDGYQRTFNDYGEAMGVLKILQAVPPLVLMFLSQTAIIAIALILWEIGKTSGEIAGDMALVLLVTARAVPATTRLAGEISSLWNAVPGIEGINVIRKALVALPKNVTSTDTDGARRRFESWEHIVFDGVDYQYSTGREMALRRVTINFKRGNSYGVVGPTGSGKTTLVDLVLGLLQPVEGQVLIDGIPLSEQDAVVWQNSIGYVPQNPMIADGSLLANVAFGVPSEDADRARAEFCLRQANLTDVLDSVGLDGPLGERGNRLSGGQRQRVAIARALYDRPTMLILDEATSALDTISEKAIQKAIESLHGTVTTITIAHRLSTIRHCDEILTLDNGRLVACGDYDSLLAESGLFRSLAAQNPVPGANEPDPSRPGDTPKTFSG